MPSQTKFLEKIEFVHNVTIKFIWLSLGVSNVRFK